MDPNEEMQMSLEVVRAERDAKRPEMETVVRTYQRVLNTFAALHGGNYREVMSGPDTWAWRDDTHAKLGFERWVVLGKSTMAGTEGYPLVTVRLSIAPRLDSFLTFSQLVVGPGETEIEYNLAMAISNHIGAFEGLRAAVSGMLAAFGGEAAVDQFIRSTSDKKEIN